MITSKIIRTLLFSLAVVLALFVVVSASRTLFAVGGDPLAAIVLHWIGVGLLVLVAADALLLVIALATRALDEEPGAHDDRDPADTE